MKRTLIPVGFLAVIFAGFLSFYEANYRVPILMYHHVGYTREKSSVYVSPKTFERQMEFLSMHNYHVMPLAELAMLVRARKRVPFNTVVITFDDGNADNIQYAFPILKKLHLPATVFMITSNINKYGWLAEEDLKIMDEAGVTIGSHTVNHAYLPDLDEANALLELKESQRRLEDILGHPVTLFSYPAGGFTEHVRSLVENAGYAAALTTNRGRTKNDPYALRRVKISDAGGNLFSFWAKISGLYHVGKRTIDVPEY